MLRRLARALRPAVFWAYRRGSWQYDVMVALILAFVFLTPRSWFRDQPRISGAQQIVRLPSETGQSLFWIDPELVENLPPDQVEGRIRRLLEQRTGSRQVTLLKTEPSKDSEGKLKGYLVQARL